MNADGSGILIVEARIPEAAASRLRSFRAAGAPDSPENAVFFDVPAIRRETSARGMLPLATETSSPNAFHGSFSIHSLENVTDAPELKQAGVLRLDSSGGRSTLKFALSRENAEALPAFFPGLDPYILETLSPPALDPYPVTASEYREMLAALLGEAAMKELDRAEARIQVKVPGRIVRASGGSVSDRTFTADLKLLDLLVLEKPIDFSVSWE
jgi:hypothetical protein